MLGLFVRGIPILLSCFDNLLNSSCSGDVVVIVGICYGLGLGFEPGGPIFHGPD